MTGNEHQKQDADGAGRRVAIAVGLIIIAVVAGFILSRGRIGPTQPENRIVTMSTGARLTIPKGYEGRYMGFMNKEKTVEGAYFCPAGTPRMEGPPPPGLTYGNIVNFTVEAVDPAFPLSMMQGQLEKDFRNRVLLAAPSPVEVNGWSGFKVHSEKEFETVLLGPARIYTFVSSADDAASDSLIRSLAQVITPEEEAHWSKASLALKGNIIREPRKE